MKLYLVYIVDLEWFQLYGVFDSLARAEAMVDSIEEAETTVLKEEGSRRDTLGLLDPSRYRLATGRKVEKKKVVQGDTTEVILGFRHKTRLFYETYTIREIEFNQKLNDDVRIGICQ